MITDIFNEEEGNRESEIARLEKQKEEKEKTLHKGGLKLVEDVLDKATYNLIRKKNGRRNQ